MYSIKCFGIAYTDYTILTFEKKYSITAIILQCRTIQKKINYWIYWGINVSMNLKLWLRFQIKIQESSVKIQAEGGRGMQIIKQQHLQPSRKYADSSFFSMPDWWDVCKSHMRLCFRCRTYQLNSHSTVWIVQGTSWSIVLGNMSRNLYYGIL